MIRLDQPWQAGDDTMAQHLLEREQEARHRGLPADAEALQRPPLEPQVYRGSGKLHGFSALITGGDAGIGRAVAQLFAREGADVAVVYLSAPDAADLTRRWVEAEGTRCLLLKGDVGDDAWCRRAVQRTVAAFGRIDVLVNTTAIPARVERLETLDELLWQFPQDGQLSGYFHMARAALAYLPRGGSIINTAAVAGLEGSNHRLDDSATRGAIQAFTQSLAGHLLVRGIRVNAVAPGHALPDQVAPAYVFLASPVCSSAISGMVLPIAGSVGGA